MRPVRAEAGPLARPRRGRPARTRVPSTRAESARTRNVSWTPPMAIHESHRPRVAQGPRHGTDAEYTGHGSSSGAGIVELTRGPEGPRHSNRRGGVSLVRPRGHHRPRHNQVRDHVAHRTLYRCSWRAVVPSGPVSSIVN